MYRLFCDADPVVVGIDKGDHWDMVVFDRHIQGCEICACAVGKIRRRLEDGLRKSLPSKIIKVAKDVGIKTDI
jgi:hypothetical protein